MTGADLRAMRKAARLSQARLADLAGVSRDCVQYWERKPLVDLRGYGPRRMLDAMGRGEIYRTAEAHRRRLLAGNPCAYLEAQIAPAMEREAQRARTRRVTCGAKTRKGTACRMKSEPGRTRCKYHGGRSTGAKTPEGRDRIRQAQLQRWAKWRADRG